MTEQEYMEKSLILLERIAVAVEGKRSRRSPGTHAFTEEELSSIKADVQARMRRTTRDDGEWLRLTDVHALISQKKGIFAAKTVLDVRRRKLIAAALRDMKVMTRKRSGFVQFLLKVVE